METIMNDLASELLRTSGSVADVFIAFSRETFQ